MVRVITPGTVTDEALLEERRDNLLLAISAGRQGYGLAWIDLAGGRFLVSEVASAQALASELARLAPAETLVGEDNSWPNFVTELPGLRKRAPWHFDTETATRQLCAFFRTRDLNGFGCDGMPLAIAAAGALLGYVEETQKSALPHLSGLAVENASETIALDAATRRNLELDTHPSGRSEHTLLGVLDRTITPMGARALRRWLHRPLRDHYLLRRRYQAIDALIAQRRFEPLREVLRGIGDLERILARVALRSARPRDLSTLRDGLHAAPRLRAAVADCDSPLLHELLDRLGEHADTARHLAAALLDQPPALLRDGGVIRAGFDAELDELRTLSTNADQFLIDLEQREKAATGIATLKVGYNSVHGYYIEISKGQSDHAPTHYTRRQTLKGAERYITEELKTFEDKVLSARERALMRERALYEGLLDFLVARIMDQDDNRNLEYEELSDEPVCVVARVDHPLRHVSNLQLKDIADSGWILPPKGSILRHRVEMMFHKEGLAPPANVVDTTAILVISSLLQQTDFLHVMPAEVARFYAQVNVLAILPIELPCKMDGFGIITRRLQILSPGAKILQQTIRDVATQIY